MNKIKQIISEFNIIDGIDPSYFLPQVLEKENQGIVYNINEEIVGSFILEEKFSPNISDNIEIITTQHWEKLIIQDKNSKDTILSKDFSYLIDEITDSDIWDFLEDFILDNEEHHTRNFSEDYIYNILYKNKKFYEYVQERVTNLWLIELEKLIIEQNFNY